MELTGLQKHHVNIVNEKLDCWPVCQTLFSFSKKLCFSGVALEKGPKEGVVHFNWFNWLSGLFQHLLPDMGIKIMFKKCISDRISLVKDNLETPVCTGNAAHYIPYVKHEEKLIKICFYLQKVKKREG